MQISKGLLEFLEDLGDHQPLNPSHIMTEMPSLTELRGLIPAIIKSDEIEFVYEKHEKYDWWFPKTRIGFMLFINHFYRIRTDPRFLVSEAVQCHRITGTEHKKRRHEELMQMVDEAKEYGCDSLAPQAFAFLEWWRKKKHHKTFPRVDHLGREIVFRTGSKAWGTYLGSQVFSCRPAAERYARDHFRLKYNALLEDE